MEMTNFTVVRAVLRNNCWSRNLIGLYRFWVISPRNSTSFTRPFLAGQARKAGHETRGLVTMHASAGNGECRKWWVKDADCISIRFLWLSWIFPGGSSCILQLLGVYYSRLQLEELFSSQWDFCKMESLAYITTGVQVIFLLLSSPSLTLPSSPHFPSPQGSWHKEIQRHMSKLRTDKIPTDNDLIMQRERELK